MLDCIDFKKIIENKNKNMKFNEKLVNEIIIKCLIF